MNLIDDARQWWRLRSNQLALVAGAVMTAAIENRAELLVLIDHLPAWVRPIITITLFSVLPIAVRISKQRDSGQKDKSNG